jgi:hypothetical protein
MVLILDHVGNVERSCLRPKNGKQRGSRSAGKNEGCPRIQGIQMQLRGPQDFQEN